MKTFSIGMALALSLAFSASTFADEPTTQPTTQPTTVTVESVASLLVGSWYADMSTLETNMFDAMPEEQRAQVMAIVAQGVMQLTNNADGTYTTFNRNPGTGEEYTETGTWQVLSVEGDQVTVQTIELSDTRGAHEVEAEPDTEVMRMQDANTFVMTNDEEGGISAISLVRQ